MKILNYIWGEEKILWGFDLSHKYTLKILCPKIGKLGCLSLQKHIEKEESWIVLSGKVWCVYIVNEVVCSKVLDMGDFLNLPAGTIHRLVGITEGCKVIETSTLDKNAIDASYDKDIIRYHCLYGRKPIETSNGPTLNKLIEEAILCTQKAISDIDLGLVPH